MIKGGGPSYWACDKKECKETVEYHAIPKYLGEPGFTIPTGWIYVHRIYLATTEDGKLRDFHFCCKEHFDDWLSSLISGIKGNQLVGDGEKMLGW